jgi:hypothetical protein
MISPPLQIENTARESVGMAFTGLPGPVPDLVQRGIEVRIGQWALNRK